MIFSVQTEKGSKSNPGRKGGWRGTSSERGKKGSTYLAKSNRLEGKRFLTAEEHRSRKFSSESEMRSINAIVERKTGMIKKNEGDGSRPLMHRSCQT